MYTHHALCPRPLPEQVDDLGEPLIGAYFVALLLQDRGVARRAEPDDDC